MSAFSFLTAFSGRRLIRRLGTVLGLFLVLFILVGVPQKAEAIICDCCPNAATETTGVMKWIENKAKVIGLSMVDLELVTGFATVVGWFMTIKKILMDGFDGVGAVVSSSAATLGDMASKMTQAKVDYKFKQTKAAADAQIARQKSVTKAGNDVVCHGVQLLQNWEVADLFSDALEASLQNKNYCFTGAGGSFCPQCLGPKGGGATDKGSSNCNPVVAAAEMAKMVCAAKGADPNEISASKNNCTMDGLAGAARNPSIIWGDLQFVPSGKAPKTQAEYRFVNALAYCYVIGGPSPQRPIKEQAETPQGAPAAVAFDKCKAQRDSVMHECLQIVARHTRPGAKGSSGSDAFDEIIEAMNKVCADAKASGADVSRLNNCQSGHSAEQARWLAVTRCVPNQHAAGVAAMTTSEQKDLARMGDECAFLSEEYNSHVLSEMQKFRSKTTDLSLLPGCGGS